MNRSKITSANGLLYRDGEVIQLPEADAVAIANGFSCAEEMVRAFEVSAKKALQDQEPEAGGFERY